MTVYYFVHGLDIAAVENIEQARKYVAAGWRFVTVDVYVQAWSERDMRRLGELRASGTLTAPLAGVPGAGLKR